MKKNYSELTGGKVLDEHELFDLKGGYCYAYGCDSNVCNTDRSGAAGLCTDAYCRKGVGPARPPRPTGPTGRCIALESL